jgi:hypothetical protein
VAEDSGEYTVTRLPANDDPMYDRTQRVRQRERLFLDTLDQHYEQFYRDAQPSYDGWREYAREEAIEVRELTKSARWRMGMGVATIVASVVYGSNSNGDFSDRLIRDALMHRRRHDCRARFASRRSVPHRHARGVIDELRRRSRADDRRPPGTQHRLAHGTRNQEWRDLLRQIYSAESGFVPEDLAIYTEPEVEAPVELPPVPVVEPAPAAETPAAESADGATTEAASDASANLVGGV